MARQGNSTYQVELPKACMLPLMPKLQDQVTWWLQAPDIHMLLEGSWYRAGLCEVARPAIPPFPLSTGG